MKKTLALLLCALLLGTGLAGCAQQAEQPAQTDAVDQAVSDIDDSVQRLVAKAMAEAKEENEKARQGQDLSDTAEFPAQGSKEPEHDDMEQTTRIDFGELQFGRDYEIK